MSDPDTTVIIETAHACQALIEAAAATSSAPCAARMSILDVLVAQIIDKVVNDGGNDRDRVFRLHEKHTRDTLSFLQRHRAEAGKETRQ